MEKKTRADIQEEIKLAVIKALEERDSCSVKAGTSTGKTYATLQILGHFNPSKITWLTNSEQLRDKDTPAEFVKWGYEFMLDRVTFMCYQTACKLENEDLGFVVCDEFDYALTEAYIKGVTNNRWTKLLAVSATTTAEKDLILQKLAPTVYTITTQQIEDLGIVNKTKYVYVDFLLSTLKTRQVTPTWKSSEQEQYLYWDNAYTTNLIKFLKVKEEINECYVKQEYSSLARLMNLKASHKKAMDWASRKRATLLSTLDTSVNLVRKAVAKILKDPNNKVLIFSNLTDQASRISSYTYNSKNKGTKKSPNPNIARLNSGEIRSLGVCSAIDRGVNLVGVNNAIFESYDSSATKGQQRGGRLKRLAADQQATIYILRPFFQKKVKIKTEEGIREEVRIYPTRACSWAESMFSDFEINESNSQVIKMY